MLLKTFRTISKSLIVTYINIRIIEASVRRIRSGKIERKKRKETRMEWKSGGGGRAYRHTTRIPEHNGG